MPSSDISQERLVRKEVALGTLREMEPPKTHIGLSIAPILEVASDDVIFDYAKPLTEGLAPARAEDAESELAQKDNLFGGTARASVIDWAVKDHYTASDVTRYRETLMIQAQLGVNSVNELPVSIQGNISEFQQTLARDEVTRRRKMDNRLEWLIMGALEGNGISYNDGRIKFEVAFGRPVNQTDEAPANGLWSLTTSDPIRDILTMQETMFDLYGVRMTRAITSRKVLNNCLNSSLFAARSGLAIPGFSTPSGGTVGSPAGNAVDPRYLIDGWGPSAAQAVIEQQTGVTFTTYDAVYRSRSVGSTTVVNNRFVSENKIIFLPDAGDVAELDDAIGFARTLTSPHPEGNWQSGFYEYEIETRDPWGLDRGTGVKAFPVFPHMELTYTMAALA
jgi:hypothetical protein